MSLQEWCINLLKLVLWEFLLFFYVPINLSFWGVVYLGAVGICYARVNVYTYWEWQTSGLVAMMLICVYHLHMISATLYLTSTKLSYSQKITNKTKIEKYIKYSKQLTYIPGESLTVCIGSASTSHAWFRSLDKAASLTYHNKIKK